MIMIINCKKMAYLKKLFGNLRQYSFLTEVHYENDKFIKFGCLERSKFIDQFYKVSLIFKILVKVKDRHS